MAQISLRANKKYVQIDTKKNTEKNYKQIKF